MKSIDCEMNAAWLCEMTICTCLKRLSEEAKCRFHFGKYRLHKIPFRKVLQANRKMRGSVTVANVSFYWLCRQKTNTFLFHQSPIRTGINKAKKGVSRDNLIAIAGFHMTSLKFELQNYWSSWDFTLMAYKSSWELIFIHIFAPNGFLVLWYTMLEFLSFCVTRHFHDGLESCHDG